MIRVWTMISRADDRCLEAKGEGGDGGMLMVFIAPSVSEIWLW